MVTKGFPSLTSREFQGVPALQPSSLQEGRKLAEKAGGKDFEEQLWIDEGCWWLQRNLTSFGHVTNHSCIENPEQVQIDCSFLRFGCLVMVQETASCLVL